LVLSVLIVIGLAGYVVGTLKNNDDARSAFGFMAVVAWMRQIDDRLEKVEER